MEHNDICVNFKTASCSMDVQSWVYDNILTARYQVSYLRQVETVIMTYYKHLLNLQSLRRYQIKIYKCIITDPTLNCILWVKLKKKITYHKHKTKDNTNNILYISLPIFYL